MKLEMDFPMTNEFIKWFNRMFCNWGPRKTPFNKAGAKVGNLAPLWSNPSKTYFKCIFVFSLLCALLFVGCYVAIQFYNSTLLNNSQTTDPTLNPNALSNDNGTCVKQAYEYLRSFFIVIGSAILFINGKTHKIIFSFI
jgi:hypothetical protein